MALRARYALPFGNARESSFAAQSTLVAAGNKKRTFVYRQMFSFCLSKPQAWYIIAAQVRCISSRAENRPCISSRASVYLPAA